jgi:dihydrofolate reductase
MTVSVFIGTSVDGYIARPNGDLDFLPAGGGEPHGYDEFVAGVDALVIGRKTFETVLSFATWPYGKKRVVVLSSRPVDLSAVRGGVVEQMAGPPAEIVSKLAASGAHDFTSTGESRFKDSCAQAWFNVSLSLACLCSSETEFLSSASCRAMCGCVT